MAKFIVIEGFDGSGKSTVIKHLKEKLNNDKFIFTKEPGGDVPVCSDIRDILLNKHSDMDINTELLLYLASQNEKYYSLIAPALNKGINVITDRWVYSTYAYQAQRIHMNKMDKRHEDIVTNFIAAVRKFTYLPAADIPFILSASFETCMARKKDDNYADKRCDERMLRQIHHRYEYIGHYINTEVQTAKEAADQIIAKLWQLHNECCDKFMI